MTDGSMSFLKDFFRVLELSDDEAENSAPSPKRQRTESVSTAASKVPNLANKCTQDATQFAKSVEVESVESANSQPESFNSALYFNKLHDCAVACRALAEVDCMLFVFVRAFRALLTGFCFTASDCLKARSCPGLRFNS